VVAFSPGLSQEGPSPGVVRGQFPPERVQAEPGDAGDLASKVQRLLADPRELAQMRQAARREYERRYTAESNYCALMAIYERVLVLPAEESR
jgi:glycosyltransferase involved in cell wall biosynthesis